MTHDNSRDRDAILSRRAALLRSALIRAGIGVGAVSGAAACDKEPPAVEAPREAQTETEAQDMAAEDTALASEDIASPDTQQATARIEAEPDSVSEEPEVTAHEPPAVPVFTITSKPEGATLYVKGKEVGVTPWTGEVDFNEIEEGLWRLQLWGYHTHVLELNPDKTSIKKARLKEKKWQRVCLFMAPEALEEPEAGEDVEFSPLHPEE